MSQQRFRRAVHRSRISTKVAIGFACVLAILAVVVCTAYVPFRSSAEGFTDLRATGYRSSASPATSTASFMNLRRFVRDYAFTADEANVDAAKQEQAALRALLQRGLGEIRNPERRRRLETSRAFRHLPRGISIRSWRRRASRTNSGTGHARSPLAPVCSGNFRTLIAAAPAAGRQQCAVLANEGLKLLLLARLNVNKVIAWHESGAAEDGGESVRRSPRSAAGSRRRDQRCRVPRTHSTNCGPARPAIAKPSARRSRSKPTINALVNGTMPDMAQKVQTDAEAIKASGIAEEQQEETRHAGHDGRTSVADPRACPSADC